ncbi:hypothetical protein DFH94DRAFT_680509 [Russula ochroleuca]|uniref:Uncharacterized protein n=1 Tax=Russula ochroleuca TaxID=152965 RepID=A0A9P5MZH5_9AGAM|nr:hypothetical protein DFH94DRAFT_680509 [Russula ochroleuca]
MWSGDLVAVVGWRLVNYALKQTLEQTVQVVEGIADLENLITGSEDHIAKLWRVSRSNSEPNGLSISLSNMMRPLSRSWSVVVSGSKDGSAALWDLHDRGMESAVSLEFIRPPSMRAMIHCDVLTTKIVSAHDHRSAPDPSLALTSTSRQHSYVPLTITSIAFHDWDILD